MELVAERNTLEHISLIGTREIWLCIDRANPPRGWVAVNEAKQRGKEFGNREQCAFLTASHAGDHYQHCGIYRIEQVESFYAYRDPGPI